MEIPNAFYYTAGFIILTNVGVIITLVTAILKGVWWVSKLDSRVERNKDGLDSAHRKIRSIENSNA